ncbi:hypothetical protein PTSG_12700 [Salpingoeca rosetta]|uniref:Amidohydrolase-related domain-containing protein n=1 Tax=Salpingoeca rosetta (strain ATCC 50818 / BSB-021) TaxID=946362 RepID=F2UIG8_SALR5|nr:uncharacterized protein PTSG_12700 [Salpingoeca rosetta]EGD76917.1 hypothetical protein PTSG_12700 [Salpingoeca rosetta]|eukprot:XP_004991288.1 hypothetical protein PTSG_12700 [Salpingoeca rosetta]
MVLVVVEATEGAVLGDGVFQEGPVYVTVDEHGMISTVGTEKPKDSAVTLSAPLLLPGFVDIHNHGVGGSHDVAYSWTNPEFTLSKLPANGVTTVLASLLPMDRESYAASLDALLPVIAKPKPGHTRCAGIHAEGPVIRDAGALPNQNLNPSLEEFTEIVDMCQGHMKVMTISPSMEPQSDFRRTRLLLDRGIRVALGHDKHATADDIVAALRTASEYNDSTPHITHIFNVSKFHHRDTSLVNFGLCRSFPNNPTFAGLHPPTVEVIGDGLHVDTLTVAGLLSARTPAAVAFITDNILHGEPGLKSAYCGRELEVGPKGKGVYVEGTTTLAGSCLSLWDCLRFLVNEQGQNVAAACDMLSATPARVARIPRVGRIKPGYFADLLLASNDLRLQHTMIAGAVAFSFAGEVQRS